MWDNHTVLSFTFQEKRWFSTLTLNQLGGIGFNAGQRAYLKNANDPSCLIKTPKPFKYYPNHYPKNSQEYKFLMSLENINSSSFSFQTSNINEENNQNNDHPTTVIRTWTDSEVVNLPGANKKWLSARSSSVLESYGFNIHQCTYLKSNHGYSGLAIKPDFVPGVQAVDYFGILSEQSEINSIDSEEEPVSSVDPTIETVHDLEVKYLDCLGIKGNSVIKAVGFRQGNSKNIIQYRKIEPSGSVSSTIEETFDSSFNFTLPKLGMINHDDYVIYIERTHKKSSPCRYRKGLRSDSLKFFNLSSKELKSVNKTNVVDSSYFSFEDSTRRLAESIFFPKKFTFKEAIDEILDFKRLSVAFTSSLAVKLDSNSNKIILQKHNWMIGEYNSKNSLFEMYINTFNHDLLKLNIPFKEAI